MFKMRDKLELFLGGTAGFDEDVWISGLERVMDIGDPTLIFGLEERIIEEMTLTVAKNKEKAFDDVDRILYTVLTSYVIYDRRTLPFLIASREKIRGAAETLKAIFKQPDTSKPLKDLIQQANMEGTLAIAALIGAKLMSEGPSEQTYLLAEGPLRNFLRGAKIIELCLQKNNVQLFP